MHRDNLKKIPFSSSRRRSRGVVSKESSGIWKVENEGIDSMKERYTIKEKHRRNTRTKRCRLRKNESSKESFGDEEVEMEEGERRKWRLKVYDEVIGVPVPRRIRSGLERRAVDTITNTSIGASEDVGALSEREVEAAELLVGLTMLHSQRVDRASYTFQSSPLPDTLASPIDSKRMKSMHLRSADVEKPSITIVCNSKACGTTSEVDAASATLTLSKIEHHADRMLVKETPKPDEQGTMQTPYCKKPSPVPALTEEKPSPNSPLDSELFASEDHHEQPSPVLLKQGDGNSNASCMIATQQSDQRAEKKSNQLKVDSTPLSSQHEKHDPHKRILLLRIAWRRSN